MITRLELISNQHYKFWEAELTEGSTTLITRWGRIGTRGQSKSYPFASYTAASQQYEEKIAEKRRKGYSEVRVTPHVRPPSPPPPVIISEPKEEPKTLGHRSLSQYMSL